MRSADTPLGELVERNRSRIKSVVRLHKGRSVSLFGSVARSEDRPGSDIDFVIEFEPGSSLVDLMHVQDALSELLGRRVDVISAGGLKPRDDHIRREATKL